MQILYDNPRTKVTVTGDTIKIVRPTSFETAAEIKVRSLGVTMYGDQMVIWKAMGSDQFGPYVRYMFLVMDDLAVTSAGMDFDEISTPSGAAYPICFSLSFDKCESILFIVQCNYPKKAYKFPEIIQGNSRKKAGHIETSSANLYPLS